MSARATALTAFAAGLIPRLAGACPMCASQQPGGVARIVALGLMILVPFVIGWVVYRALRRADGARAETTSGSPAASRAGDGHARAVRELSP